NLFDRSTQAETAPGTETLSQPRSGIALRPLKCSGVHAAGERPEAFRPCSLFPSHTMAKASLPMPLEIGSTPVSVVAAAIRASAAVPRARSIRSPAWAASGWEVETTFRASVGRRYVGYGVSKTTGLTARWSIALEFRPSRRRKAHCLCPRGYRP